MSAEEMVRNLRNLMSADTEADTYIKRIVAGSGCNGLQQYVENNPEEAAVLLEGLTLLVVQDPEVNDVVNAIREESAKQRKNRDQRIEEARARAAEMLE